MRFLVSSLLGLLVLCIVPRPARAETPSQEAIDRAIRNAVKGLKEIQESTGLWSFDADDASEKNIGSTALAGLALLECGVQADDPAIVKAAAVVRSKAPRLTEVYSISLALLFLDRLGEAGPVKALAAKLLAGNRDGGWSYKCGGAGPKEASGADQPAMVSDNSNTQFAILSLWVARKRGVAVDEALQAADQRFRRTQHTDGCWGYSAEHERPMPTMTCAGLLGLALGYGSAKDKPGYLRTTSKGARDIADDPAIVAALGFLNDRVGNEPSDHPQFLYYVWSLGSVCLALRVKTIGQTDWYEWGAEKLIEKQLRDGYWRMKYGAAIDTSFAMLFLARSDLLGDIRAGSTPPVAAEKPSAGADASKKPPVEKPLAPPPETDHSAILAVKLVRAEGPRRAALLAEYRQAKGVDYTLALAAAIPDLQGDAQDSVRAALAGRFERMSTRTLREYLRDEDREIRRAAAVACQVKKLRELVPDLIRLLRDPAEGVPDAAHLALKHTTGQAFTRDPLNWEVWWKANGDKD